MPSDKAFREVNKKLNKKKRDQSKLKAEDQQNYVDSSRSIAVSLDSKELSRALKHFSKDFVWTQSILNEHIFIHITLKDYEDINKGIVNSLMYEKQAKRFTKINQVDSAIKYLSIGKNSFAVFRFNLFFHLQPTSWILKTRISWVTLLVISWELETARRP